MTNTETPVSVYDFEKALEEVGLIVWPFDRESFYDAISPLIARIRKESSSNASQNHE